MCGWCEGIVEGSRLEVVCGFRRAYGSLNGSIAELPFA